MNMRLMALLAAVALTANVHASEELAKSKGCLACHALDKKVVGPAFKDVAAKYAGQADAAGKLAAKVVAGGKGTWGPVPMPPNKIHPDEALALVAWVLALK